MSLAGIPRALWAFVATAFVLGCMPVIPPEALTLQPEAVYLRRLQTRRFDTTNESELLQASLGVLQDLGFELDESESDLGLLVASKTRDATDPGQLASKIIMNVMTGDTLVIDAMQRIRVSLITRVISSHESTVRVTFQRIVWDEQGRISRSESLEDPELYQEFFFKLSKAVFLEAHGI